MKTTGTIILYGRHDCRDCQSIKNFLDVHGIPYLYIDIDEHPSAALEVTNQTNGYQKIPLLVFPDKTVLIEPNIEEIEEKIKG